jgi:hypothetical protein
MAELGITGFLSNFTGGGARPNRFIVQFIFPQNLQLQLAPQISVDQFRVSCKATSIPTSNTGTVGVKYMGRTINMPGDKEFDPWTITILNDISYPIRYAFEEWTNAIMGHLSNVESPSAQFVTDFYGSAYVYQLGRKGDTPTAVYFMDKFFPTQIGEIALSYDSDNQIEEFPVTFALNEWTSVATDNKL